MGITKVKLIREVKEDEKLAPQQKVIYDQLVKLGVGKEVDRDTLVKNVEQSNLLTTKQDIARVVSYYMQDFAKKGIAETIKPAPEPKAEKKSEPSKPGEAAAKSPADGEKKPEKKAAA